MGLSLKGPLASYSDCPQHPILKTFTGSSVVLPGGFILFFQGIIVYHSPSSSETTAHPDKFSIAVYQVDESLLAPTEDPAIDFETPVTTVKPSLPMLAEDETMLSRGLVLPS